MRWPVVVAAVTVIVAASCGESQSEWGPLALVDATGDTARTEGTVRITDECVLLDTGGETQLLVWPADRSRWNRDDRTISFTSLAGVELFVASDQFVVLGGGGSSAAEDGERWADRIDWARRPAPACVTDSAWFVSDIQLSP
jgi:hypothetical protein